MTLRQSATPAAFLYVSDRDQALDFYCETLWIRAPSFGPVRRLRQSRRGHQDHAHPVLGWNEDIGTAVAALGDKGIVYEGMGQDALGIWTAPGD